MDFSDFDEITSRHETNFYARANESSDHIILHLDKRLKRREECGKPFLIYLKKDLEEKITKYCSGNKTLIINHLIHLGLMSLIKENKK